MMKKVALHLGLVVAVVLGYAVVSVSAQTSPRYTSHIPFDFTIDQKSFKAGDYVIDVVNSQLAMKVLSFRSSATGEKRFVTTIPKTVDPRMDRLRLVFNFYGGRYVLTQMLTSDFGVEFVGRPEKWLANHKTAPEPQTVRVALGTRGR